MQTKISSNFSNIPNSKEAEEILRSCVHCGFCTATCPTYQLLNDELDSPRGRIYLIKQVLEGNEVTAKTQLHLDRCLTCRSCETTCPSGVKYSRLIDIGREIVAEKVARKSTDKFQRYMLRKILPYPSRVSLLLKAGRTLKPILPSKIRQKIPYSQAKLKNSEAIQAKRKMLILQGCAQSVITPLTNQTATLVFNKLNIELITAPKAGCCGAVSHHLTAHDEANDFIRNNIDAWWPYVEQNIEAIVITASGCGVMVKDYGKILANDSQYAQKAQRISELTKDISEIIVNEPLNLNTNKTKPTKVAFHTPCTLQHGQKILGKVENILTDAGYTLTKVDDAHLCCGSAGTYSILQPALSKKLLHNKITALEAEQPDVIATANIGCQMHLGTKANVPIKHWVELLNDALLDTPKIL